MRSFWVATLLSAAGKGGNIYNPNLRLHPDGVEVQVEGAIKMTPLSSHFQAVSQKYEFQKHAQNVITSPQNCRMKTRH